ncbi:hypothetical protein B0T17DRAFT_587878 [Bombardia bombarda]|uniref:Short-chain dehydrogenase n=1 Tax=Bombardia bombarda TaxID=252184 RepID=A0AA39XNF5_9PEZI|nr:hypothetical protein B0T17DRAFT_587878 [Bombardia bombarda]
MASFGFETTGDELVSQFADRVTGRIFLITGPSHGGIGAETAISLARAKPASLILVGRALERIQPTIDAIKAIDPSIPVKFIPTDLTSLASVRKAAQTILDDASIPHIDVVINNAAVMACPYSLTEDGFELQLAAAHLGHFVLTNRILPKVLLATKTQPTPGATRIINVSSIGNRAGGIRWDDPNYTVRPHEYHPFDAYGQAKTSNILFTVELDRRLAAAAAAATSSAAVRSFALHPGSITTNLGRHLTQEIALGALEKIFGPGAEFPPRKTLQQGCATTLRAALDPALDAEKDGHYLHDCQFTTKPVDIAPWALDEADARRIWKWTEELVGEKFDL